MCVSLSVVSDSCNPMDYTVHGILQVRILEWVAFPFSRGPSQPRKRTQVSHLAGGFFTSWATREALWKVCTHSNWASRVLLWRVIYKRAKRLGGDLLHKTPVGSIRTRGWPRGNQTRTAPTTVSVNGDSTRCGRVNDANVRNGSSHIHRKQILFLNLCFKE